MIRFLITYDLPRDPAAFDPHYRDVHQPLTALRPGIHNYPGPSATLGPGHHQVAEMTWADWDAAKRAFTSPQGQAATADMANLDAPTPSRLSAASNAPSS